MTIQDLGSIGEFVAAIATVATLVYLAIQIRSNTAALRSESRRGSRKTGEKGLLALLGSPICG